jgi:hypothetical protein
MEEVNDSSKLVAKSIEELKGYVAAVHEHGMWELKPVTDSIELLEKALERLVSKM